MEKIERDVRPNQMAFDYPTMQESELMEIKIPATNDCHLWLCTTQKNLPMALRLLDKWNFKYVSDGYKGYTNSDGLTFWFKGE
jgi:N6-adenosine-specific RNA methylase IME4